MDPKSFTVPTPVKPSNFGQTSDFSNIFNNSYTSGLLSDQKQILESPRKCPSCENYLIKIFGLSLEIEKLKTLLSEQTTPHKLGSFGEPEPNMAGLNFSDPDFGTPDFSKINYSSKSIVGRPRLSSNSKSENRYGGENL